MGRRADDKEYVVYSFLDARPSPRDKDCVRWWEEWGRGQEWGGGGRVNFTLLLTVGWDGMKAGWDGTGWDEMELAAAVMSNIILT